MAKLIREKNLMHELKRIIILGVTVVMVIILMLALPSCVKPKGEFIYNIAYAESYSESTLPFNTSYLNGEIESDLSQKIDSKQELIALSNEKNYPFYNENDTNYNSKLSKKIREYNEEYFNKKSLILVIGFGKSYASARIEDIAIVNNVMTITFVKPDTLYETEKLTTFVYIIEVNKDDVKIINEIRIKMISNGTIYSLEYAYEQGFLSAEDIKSIGYYHHDGRLYVEGEGFKETDYQPIAKTPNEIDLKTQEKIKQTCVDYIYSAGVPFAKKENVVIGNYYGIYNGYVAMMIRFNIELAIIGPGGIAMIADTVFYYVDNTKRIMLWKENENYN